MNEVLERDGRKVIVSFLNKNMALRSAYCCGDFGDKYPDCGNKASFKKVVEDMWIPECGNSDHFLLRSKRVTFAVNYHELYSKYKINYALY
jgi:hypothetical protein